MSKLDSQLIKLCDEIDRIPVSDEQVEAGVHAYKIYKSLSSALICVLNEREKQDGKWGEQNHNPYIYLAILLEEIGELAQAILQTQFGGNKGGWANVRKEAVHSAAVALALIECLDRNKWNENDIDFHRKGENIWNI